MGAPHFSFELGSPEARPRLIVGGSLGATVLTTWVLVASAIIGGGGEAGPTSAEAAPRPTPAAAAPVPAASRLVDGEKRGLKIAWVGDTVLGSRHGIPPDGGRGLLAGVRDSIVNADLTIGNLEGTFGVGGLPKCPADTENCFTFQAPPEHAATLAWAGFDVMNLANNHAYDYGEVGQAATIQALATHDVDHTGTPGRITLVERLGLRVAFVGFAPYPWAPRLDDIPGATALIRKAAGRADVVVVAMHVGAEGSDRTHTPVGAESHLGEPRGDSRAFAHAAVDAGADLVVGSGPHVVRGMERYKGRLIAYSTGNFAGYHTFSEEGTMGLAGVLRVVLDERGRPLRGKWDSLRIVAPGQPVLDEAGASAQLVGQVSREDFGDAAVVPDADGALPLGDQPPATLAATVSTSPAP